MNTDDLVSLKDARNTILAHYHYILGLSKDALKKQDWEVYGRLRGQLNGLAYALGATNYKQELPQ